MTAGAARPDDPASTSVDTWLARFPVLDPPTSTAGAAVTLVLRRGAESVEVLLIERSANPVDPASGQVALPGGRVDDADGSLRRTAERELEEEVGLSISDLAGPLRFVGVEPAPRFQLHVGVFAGALADTGRSPRAARSDEVAHVFWFPCDRLSHEERAEVLTGQGFRDLPVHRYEGHVLWGFTRHVLREFFGLSPEPDVGGRPYAPSPRTVRREAASGDGPPA